MTCSRPTRKSPICPRPTAPRAPITRRATASSQTPGVGSIDPQTGVVTTGKGAHPRVYAIALLSVGDKAATWPIVFEPRRSFRAPPLPPLRWRRLPLARVLAAPATSLPNVQPPPNPPPLNFTFPSPPQLPQLPPLNAPAVSAPDAARTPATAGQPVRDRAVGQPPARRPQRRAADDRGPATRRRRSTPHPPAARARKPARSRPPSPSRRRAPPACQGAGVDTAESPTGGHRPSSHDPPRPRQARPARSRPIAHRDQPSAWSRGALYGGGLTHHGDHVFAGLHDAAPNATAPPARTTIPKS